MVKFSKQFEGQLVPEWKEAFVDYWQLKKDLKKIQAPFNKPHSPSFSQRLFSPLTKLPLCGSHSRKDHGVIQVHRKLASTVSNGDVYETELLDQFAGTDAAKEFFARLDLQLNKVNQFYKGKEKDFMERGDSLKKQMDILIDLKAALKQQRLRSSSTKDDPSISCSITSDEDSVRSRGEQEQGQEKTECEFEGLDEPEKEVKAKKEKLKLMSLSGTVISSQGKSLRINIPLTTPTRTITALTYSVWDDLVNQSKKCGPESGRLNINKTKLHHAEKMIRGAFMELYKGLGYLRTFRQLNMLAFAKILKKFDKITGKQALVIYLKEVERSYFNSSDKAIKLMDEVEELFIKHFADNDQRKAMKYLKPHMRKESHAVTFFIGLFTGCFIALFIGYCIMAHIAGMYTGQTDSVYMETVYPVLSMFSLLFLHLFLYGCNIFLWQKTRINYSFIFEFAPTKELKYRDVFLICTTSMTIVVGVLFAHLALIAKDYTSTRIQAIPGILLLVIMHSFLPP